ncbi:CoA ester lyase [Comamonas testosteroni]|uniref:HpcH/HpaI aldolase n=1 Tax=Comamonas testosteroni (strain DSM 14576 / KF-1) TaxID=399795 RepID=B7X015_COMTK|nr:MULTISPECIES: CoA ester lyase [Comamonas]EED69923.1 HpcH/HpaI aldolase [Comamonas testosteroni KF-1]TYK71627.1 CoA ester lyase [Comamonas sp. Z3]WQG67863.1 CoA ester lyase [Comamonas testosteroni]
MSTLLHNACTFLFVPANRPQRLVKALASGADMVIADCEDAVAPGDKQAARLALEQAVQQLSMSERERLMVRINAWETPWFDEDLRALARLVADGVAGAVVPKAESAAVLQQIAGAAGPRCALLPLVESVAGLDACDALAGTAQVVRLAFGHLDFQVDAGMQCEPDEAELLPVRLALILASRRRGLARAVDGVTIDTKDAARLESDTGRALRMGFGAKLCIHPDQVGTVNRVFAPCNPAVAQARAVVQAMQASGGGVCTVNGKMVDAPVLHLAQQTLARHIWAQQRMQRDI